MTTDKNAQLEYLKKEEKRLKESIDRYLSIDLNDMEQSASKLLKAVQAKIKELEG